jgi:hypothetical protein
LTVTRRATNDLPRDFGWMSNIVSDATVTQSSEVLSAAYAIDGDTDSYSSTTVEQSPWLDLSFAETNWIDVLHIWPRPGAGVRSQISNASCAKLIFET